MSNHSRFTPVLALIGALALGGASTARAQDTSAASRQDTSGYGAYRNRSDSTADTSGAAQRSGRTDTTMGMQHGAPADTALRAKPGVQTGPAASDTGRAAHMRIMSAADTVVCMDGSNAAHARRACRAHGGIDWAATEAALKARGRLGSQSGDSTAQPSDTARVNKTGASGYKYHGAPTDTALKAKPGTQTGRDTNSAKSSDSSSSNQ